MPIYAYKCGACGKPHDALQKMSDAPLSVCPHCGAAALTKQVTAAGFQLKGSGWYVTDFRDGGKGAGKGDKAAEGGSNEKPVEKSSDKPADAAKSADSATPSAAPAPASSPNAAPSPAPSSSPAPAPSGSTPTQG